MQFRSSFHVFKPRKNKFKFLHRFLSESFDCSRMSAQIYHDFYHSYKHSKNRPYDPSSLVRLIFMLEHFSDTHKFSSHNSKLDIDEDLIALCGFSSGETPSYSTFFYFKKRMSNSFITLLLNKLRSLLVKFFLKTCYSKTNKIILAIDSKPIATDGQHPRGTIHSHNKFLNGKLGIKIHTLNIIYPFFFPIAFKFTPAHHHDSPVLRELFPTLSPIIEYAKIKNTPLFLTADKGYAGYENLELCFNSSVIPIIASKKNSKVETVEKFFQHKGNIYCTYSATRLSRNGVDQKGNRINYRCYDKECTVENCSGRLWVPAASTNLKKPPGEFFLILNNYFKLASSQLFADIYSHRGKTELLHSIWHNAYDLRNVFYLRDFKALVRFEFNLMKKISYDALFTLNTSPLKQYPI